MKNSKKILDKYLPNRTGYPVEALEEELIMAMEECARKYHKRKVKQLGLGHSTTHFTTKEECEQEAIKFTKDNLKAASLLLSDDYKTGYKEGIEHYLTFKNNL